jgi:hypothetical protein
MPAQPISAPDNPPTDVVSTERSLSSDTCVASMQLERPSLPGKGHNVEVLEASLPVTYLERSTLPIKKQKLIG